ncbi:FAD-linked oxidase [Sesbania bispinosa]|nr:FAD-linked oxidase [Sesbania bispinosa]
MGNLKLKRRSTAPTGNLRATSGNRFNLLEVTGLILEAEKCSEVANAVKEEEGNNCGTKMDQYFE